MIFEFEQVAEAPRRTVVGAFCDPAFYEALGEMPDLGVEGVLAHSESDAEVSVSVRFAFRGDVSPAVRAVVDPKKLTWVTHSVVRPAEHASTFDVVPDHYPDRLVCHGGYRFLESSTHTRMIVGGELVVRMPLVGRAVERAILSGFRQHVAGEAELLARWAG